MNKKGDLSILLLVLFTVLLVGITLFVFISNQNKVERQISGLSVIQGVYTEEEVLKFYMSSLADDILKGRDDMTMEEFLENFRKEFSDLEGSFSVYNEQIQNGDYEISIENGIFEIKNFEIIKEGSGKIKSVNYISNLKFGR